MKKPEEQLTFADLDLPKKRGRPRKADGEKLTQAERAKRYRDKKRAQGVRMIPVSAAEAAAAAPLLQSRAVAFDLAARLKCAFDITEPQPEPRPVPAARPVVPETSPGRDEDADAFLARLRADREKKG